LGDFFAQNLEHVYRHHTPQEHHGEPEKEKKKLIWNKRRTVSVGIFGGVWGFCAHFWYHLLDEWGLEYYPGSPYKQLFFKLTIDMIFFEPFAVGLFFVGVGVLEGQNYNEISGKLSTNFIPIVTMDFIIWPVITIFVFYFIPLDWQVILFACVDLFYDSFLSLVGHNDLFHNLTVSIKKSISSIVSKIPYLPISMLPSTDTAAESSVEKGSIPLSPITSPGTPEKVIINIEEQQNDVVYI